MSVICDAHKKMVGVELLYSSVHMKFKQLEFRCGRVNQHPAEWAPEPWLSSIGERERNAVLAIRVGVIMSQFWSVSNSLSYTNLSLKWEVYFSKELCRSSLLCRRYDFACIYVCIVGQGYATWSTNSLTTIPQSITLTITPRGPPLYSLWNSNWYMCVRMKIVFAINFFFIWL